jgi:metal-dependent amidase/aminoacylase/carboxypeptidase family protein
MFGIGSGEESPSLHNPDYDFPDEILPNAIQLFHKISLRIL